MVSREGLPLGYEVLFDGNRTDVTTVKGIVETKLSPSTGPWPRVWVMDRGMVSQKNLEFSPAGGRRYRAGTPKAQLKRFEQELLKADWRAAATGRVGS